MTSLVDKIATKLAGKVFTVFHDQLLASGFVKDEKESQLIQGLDAMKSMFAQGDKRPLEVNLNFPETCNQTLQEVVDRMNNSIPTEKDLLSLHCRTKRLLNIIENILIQHEKLTLEAIRTLRTIRLVTKWTSLFVFISLLYLYIRKFHSQSPMYQIISQRRNVVALMLAGVGITVYCYSHKEIFLRTIATIS